MQTCFFSLRPWSSECRTQMRGLCMPVAAALPLLLIGTTAWQETSGTHRAGKCQQLYLPEACRRGFDQRFNTSPVTQAGFERGEPESTR